MSGSRSQAFTVAYPTISRTLNAPVHIAAAGFLTSTSPKAFEFHSLWDTGANVSVITRRVVDALNLMPVSKGRASTPQGEYESSMYYIDLLLPNHVIIRDLLVMEGQPAGCDILVGMDVISRGDFAVSPFDGKSTFTFRVPSLKKIDFVQQDKLQAQVGTHGKGTKKYKPKNR